MNVNPELRSLFESPFLRVAVLGGAFVVAAAVAVVEGPHIMQHALELGGNFLMQHSPVSLPPIHGDPGAGELSGIASQQAQHLGHTAIKLS